MTDIVTRLRKSCASSHLPGLRCSVFYDGGCMPCQAADEIERLRADAQRWSNWAIDYACDDMKCECDRCEAVRKAWDETQRNR